jgi:hypothetical protein
MHLIHGARVRCPPRQQKAQPRHPHGRGHPDPQPAQRGRAYFAKNLAEGKARKEALRVLKGRISDAIYACLQADAARAGDPPAGHTGVLSQPSATLSRRSEHHVAAAPHTVYRAWLDPDRVRRWMAPGVRR